MILKSLQNDNNNPVNNNHGENTNNKGSSTISELKSSIKELKSENDKLKKSMMEVQNELSTKLKEFEDKKEMSKDGNLLESYISTKIGLREKELTETFKKVKHLLILLIHSIIHLTWMLEILKLRI